MSAVFSCEVNKPNMAARWLKNGSPIQPSDKYVITVDGGKHQLEVKNCQKFDAGIIEVCVEDAKSAASLEVKVVDLALVKPLSDVTSDVTPVSVTFSCELTKGGLPAEWTRNGRLIGEDRKHVVTTSDNTYQLQINKASPEDEGEYSVTVKGLTSTAQLKFAIRPSLSISKKLEEVVVIKVGQSTMFEIPFTGHPQPSISWLFKGEELPKSKRLDVETKPTSTSLKLRNAERGDRGTYSVTAKNEVCEVSADITLDVLDSPSSPVNLAVAGVEESSVSLTWEKPEDDGGSDITNYIVDKKEVGKRAYSQVAKTGDCHLVVDGLREGNSYLFQVTAVNSIGKSEPAELSQPVVPVSLTGKYKVCAVVYVSLPSLVSCYFSSSTSFQFPAPPDAPQDVVASDITKQRAVITWQPPASNGGEEITGYIVERSTNGTGRWVRQNKTPLRDMSFTADDLTEGTEYRFRVTALNRRGESSPSNPCTPFTAMNPYDVPGAPDAPQVSDVTDNSMKVTWQPPTHDGGSPVISYYLEHKISTELRWSPATSDQLTSTEYAVRKLKTGTEYQFRVVAVNKAGAGKWSAPSSDVICKAPVHGEAPKLLEPLKSVTAVMPDSAVLTCKVNRGTPVSKITWYMGDKSLDSRRHVTSYNEKTEEATLIVKETALTDSSLYKISVGNDFGQFESQCDLVIQQKPEFTVSSGLKKEITAKAKTNVNLETTFVGHPEPNIEWLHNDQPITSNNVRVSSTSKSTKLSVSSVTSQSVGRYKATISNPAGSDTITFSINVIDVPSAPQDLEVTEITKSSLTVKWKTPDSDGGVPIASYHVERQDTKRSTWVSAGSCGGETHTFTIKKLAEGNEYRVRISAENEVGVGPAATLPEPVTVQNQFSAPGSPEGLQATDITPKSVVLTWSKPRKDGGSPITGYIVERKSQFNPRWTRASRLPATSSECTLNDLTEGTEYEFRVSAENEAGVGSPSNTAGPIKAQEPKQPVAFTKELQDVNVKEDNSASFSCQVNKKDLTPKWLKNGTPIKASPKFHMKSDGVEHSLIVDDCQMSDEAHYGVEFDGVSSSAGLFVEKEPLELLKGLSDVTLDSVPQDVTLQCEVSKPNLPVRWLKDGRPVDETAKIKMRSSDTQYSLLIHDANHDDKGEYTVLVKGITSSAKLAIQVKPALKLDKKYEDTIILHAGKSTVFEVPFEGYPKPEVFWLFDGKELPKSRRLEAETTAALMCLRLKQAERGDSGDYSVSIKNELGSVVATIALIVLDKPEPPHSIEAKAESETSVQLTWQEPHDNGGSPVLHYLIEKKEVNRRSWTSVGKTSERSIVVCKLTEGQAYQLSVRAVNAIGESEAVQLNAPLTPVSKSSK